MIDLSKKYYAVHVQTSNELNGIHYIPFTDEEIEQMKEEYAPIKSEAHWYYEGEYLTIRMQQYLLEKFSYNACEDEHYWVMMNGEMEPIDMQAIVNEPTNPRKVEVIVSFGEDECIQFNIPEAEEKIQRKEGEYDGSIITGADEANPYNPCIQIWKYDRDLPHLSNKLRIYKLSIAWWEIAGNIESIEHDDNMTTYHCFNSLFKYKVQVIAHILSWYDDETPIFKE